MRCDLQEGLPAIPSLRKRLEIALDLARALQYLHAKDLSHRDVKAQNVLVSELMSERAFFMGKIPFKNGQIALSNSTSREIDLRFVFHFSRSLHFSFKFSSPIFVLVRT